MRRSLSVFICAPAAAFLLLRLPQACIPLDGDSSWQELLQFDWNQRARCGVETMFTYGPGGFLLGTSIVSAVEGARDRYFAAIAWAVVVAMALFGVVGRMPTARWRAAYVAAALLTSPIAMTSDAFLLNACLGILTLFRLTAADRPPATSRLGPLDLTLLLLTCLVFAATGWTKFTHLVQGVALIGVVTGVLLLQRRLRIVGLVLATFVLAMLGTWLALGQRLGDLPAYLRGSWEIANGYQAAQGRRGPDQDLIVAEFLVCGHLLLAGWAVWAARTLPRLGAAAIGMVTLFFAWKSAFVRHDEGHAMIFYGVAALSPFLLLAAAGRVPSWPFRVLALAMVLVGIGENVYVRERIGIGFANVPASIAHNLALLPVGAFDRHVAEMLASERLPRSLPETRARVGKETIDLIGLEQGYLFENGLEISHRPVFQSYSVFTPYLQRLNGAFYAGAEAPRYVLAQVKPIDEHFPLAEDSTAWKVLLDRYYPVGAEKGLLLLERQSQPSTQAATLAVERSATMGEWVDVPPVEGWYELSIQVAQTMRGKIAAFAFRPGEIFLEVRRGDATSRFEIAPRMVEESFLLDPLIESEADLLAGYVGEPLPRVTAFRVVPSTDVEATHFEPEYGLRLLHRQPPAAADAQSAAHARSFLMSLRFPTFSLVPERVEPPRQANAYGNGDDQWVLTHAPCRLYFTWPGGRHVLAAEFRIDPGAYEHAGDGAFFRVSAGEAGARRVVFERQLDPFRRPEDRGAQPLRLELALQPGETLVLETDPGAQGNSSFDWTCWRRVRLDPR
ncbi:MAG: hypothetical protein R3F56_21500 [Planctomycetota bacterium]